VQNSRLWSFVELAVDIEILGLLSLSINLFFFEIIFEKAAKNSNGSFLQKKKKGIIVSFGLSAFRVAGTQRQAVDRLVTKCSQARHFHFLLGFQSVWVVCLGVKGLPNELGSYFLAGYVGYLEDVLDLGGACRA
jgi:hypothetical protein